MGPRPGPRLLRVSADHRRGYDRGMGLIVGLLILWLVLSVIGFVVKSLFWLAIIGLVLFLATLVYGFVKGLFTKNRA